MTEQNLGETRLIRINRLYSVLSRINEAIIYIHDRDELYKEACRIVVEDGGFLMAWIGMVEPSTLLVKPVAHCCGEYEGSYIDGLVVSVQDIPEGRGPIGITIREGRHVICNDIENEPRMLPWREKALSYGYRASASFPLHHGGQIIGSLAIYCGEPSFFNKEEIAMIERVTENISFATGVIENEEQAKLAMKALSRSEANLTNAQRIAHIGCWERDLATNEEEWSLEVYRIFGVNPNESRLSYQTFLNSIHPDDVDFVKNFANEAIKDKKPFSINFRIVLHDGPEKTVNAQGEVDTDDTGRPIKIRGTVQDITELKSLEKQLLHSQKMEAVGQLAGGIAHDFNNALTAILGFGKLLLMKRGNDELVKNYTQHIVDAGESAASLVQGILAFSRKQTIIPQPIDITELVRNVKNILLRLIGEDMELRTVLTEGPLIVKADPTQIEQILMNLATNARDAMPDGGVITISTELVKMDEGFVDAIGYGATGTYALLSFADTGNGMDEETKRKIFEPFFTTKEVGKGTGLGLAMVYGIIKQHDGFINVYSEPGQGTIFEIYLPVMEAEAVTKEAVEAHVPKGGTETVLLVEDDEMVRSITLRVLEDFGYNVIVAVNGEDAVKKFIENKDKIHLCITDMVMPKMGGMQALEEMRKIRPDIRVIFMSAYAADKIKSILEDGLDFISKPVSPSEFLSKVREVLER